MRREASDRSVELPRVLGPLGHRSSLPLELGKVDELEVGRECPDQPGGILQGNPPEFSNEGDLLAGVVALAELLGPRPDRLLQLIERDALMLALIRIPLLSLCVVASYRFGRRIGLRGGLNRCRNQTARRR